MNPIAEEIESYLGSASMTDEEYLAHYGMPRRSGRYPWGSGEDPYQSSRDFLPDFRICSTRPKKSREL